MSSLGFSQESQTSQLTSLPQSQKDLDDSHESDRSDLIKAFMYAAKQESLPDFLFNCLWLADENCLKEHTDKMLSSSTSVKIKYLQYMAGQARLMLRAWQQKSKAAGSGSKAPSGTSTPAKTGEPLNKKRKVDASSPPSTNRGSATVRAASAVDKRDKGKSCITGQSHVQKAHIYPHCLIHEVKKDLDTTCQREDLWYGLKMFWGNQAHHDVLRLIGNQQDPLDIAYPGTDCIENFITLTASEHLMWNNGCFALKPVKLSEDKKELTIEFWWNTKTASFGEKERFQRVLAETQPRVLRWSDRPSDGDGLFYESDRQYLKSGDEIVIKTEDPDKFPLPSIALLELQWNLQRIQGMTASAVDGIDDEDDARKDEDTDGVESGTQLPDIEDFLNNLRDFEYADDDPSNVEPSMPLERRHSTVSV